MPFREQSRFAILHRGRFVLGISGEEIANLEGIKVRVGARVFFYLFYLCSRSFRFGSTPFYPFLHSPLVLFHFFMGILVRVDFLAGGSSKPTWGLIPRSGMGAFGFFSGGFGRLGTTNVRVTSNLSLSFFSLPFFDSLYFSMGSFARIRIEYGSFLAQYETIW